ncbi:MAG: sigma-70 family RNA polymerase sigma factor, partial [Candidatus Hydrogenedentes bacterium]|nr:sigma-70 family RNA polymerase sigma factor [Candidatus Hydrogenedentota bacterium]
MVAADQLLLNQWIANRDAQAFKILTTRYCKIVYGTSLRILRSTSDAEEVTQDCFVALATAQAGPQGSLGAWLHRVATHKSLNRRRSDSRRREREDAYARARAATTEAQWDDISQFIDQSIEALPEKIRMAVVAHFIEDESVTSIASRECVTHGAISQRIHRGVEMIRERMQRNGISIGVAAMAAMLSQQASAWPAVPANVSAWLGKLA